MTTYTIRLPFPYQSLNPNKKAAHWSQTHRARKAYRTECGWKAKSDGLGTLNADSLSMTVTFFPPDERRRDRDNLIGAFKSGQDAIADVTGIDDSKFAVSYAPLGNAIRPDGLVRVDLTWNVKAKGEAA